MPVDWKTKESYQRLLAAMVAATKDMKLDYRKIATMYGNSATYDSIEGRFRIIKKEAEQLRNEVESGARPEAPVRGSAANANGSGPNTPVSTPKKPRATAGGTGSGRKKNGAGVVAGSRVEKTPTKKARGAQNTDTAPLTLEIDDDVVFVKEEHDATSGTSATSSMVQTPSFTGHDTHNHPTHHINSNSNGNPFTPAPADTNTHSNTWHHTPTYVLADDLGNGLSSAGVDYPGMTPYDDADDGSFERAAGSFMAYGGDFGFRTSDRGEYI